MEEVDVLICGGGPVGLLTAYCLARNGLTTYIIEQHDRAKQIMYGRAAMIAPRTLEMLDQLDLLDDLIQIGFVTRGQVHYNQKGEKIDIVRYATDNLVDTFHDYLLICRQKYTEQAFHEGYKKYSGRSVKYGTKLLDFDIVDSEPDSGYALSTLEIQDGTRTTVKSNYIVGADGGRSTIRELAGIGFEGGQTNRRFIRIDGITKTDMPKARDGNAGVESASHGSVLWACLDHGRTRVGFAFPQTLWEEKGAQVTQEDVIEEAKKAMHPFTLEFETVDWWTAYSVGQKLASTYRSQGRVLIAGDAAHTHSSAAAQGMNTGIHDAVNLSWKLAGHIKGWFTERVLDSYTTERRAVASKIIEQDSIVALLTAGEIPKQYQGIPDFDLSQELSDIFKRNQALNSGIGVSYVPDGCTAVESSTRDKKLTPGERAPDVLVQRPCMRLNVRLHETFKNVGKFTVIIFCGDPTKTVAQLKSWRKYIDGPKSYTHYQANLFQELSIIVMQNDYSSVTEKLGMDAFGRAYIDVDGSAHGRYGFSTYEATLVVLRPDGTIGLLSQPPDGAAVSGYFAGFLKVEKSTQSGSAPGDAMLPDAGATRDEAQDPPGAGEVDV